MSELDQKDKELEKKLGEILDERNHRLQSDRRVELYNALERKRSIFPMKFVFGATTTVLAIVVTVFSIQMISNPSLNEDSEEPQMVEIQEDEFDLIRALDAGEFDMKIASIESRFSRMKRVRDLGSWDESDNRTERLRRRIEALKSDLS